MSANQLLPDDDFSKLLYANALIKEQSARIKELLSITTFLETELEATKKQLKKVSEMNGADRKAFIQSISEAKMHHKNALLKQEVLQLRKHYRETFENRITNPYLNKNHND